MNKNTESKIDTSALPKGRGHLLVAKYSVAQSVTEIGLGSFVHAARIPLGGHLLSLNQGLLLTLASKNEVTRRSCVSITSRIGNTTAVLKALSPVGNRITPMLAISVQGLLFSLGVGVFGPSLLGVILGSALLSVWGFLQPLLMAYLIFGNSFTGGLEKVWKEIAHGTGIPVKAGLGIFCGVLAAKAILAALVAILSWQAGRDFEERYLRKLEHWSKKGIALRKPLPSSAASSPVRAALRDLLNPGFILALGLSVGFFAISGSPSGIQVGLFILRIMAGTLLLFWGFRAVPRAWIERGLSRFPQLRSTVDQALAKLSRT